MMMISLTHSLSEMIMKTGPVFAQCRGGARLRYLLILCISMFVIACAAAETPPAPRRQSAPPEPGFFERLRGEFTERGCNVGRFVCPYGLGPAGEPCECTDPSGRVLQGRTVR